MANSIQITLDTTQPASVAITLNGAAVYTSSAIVTAALSTADSDTTNYQMLLWGDVDNTYNANIQTLEANSTWISFSSTQSVKLSATDGLKTVSVKIRDDVFNASSASSDSISVDTALPTLTVSSPDVSKISKIAGRNTASFSFSSDVNFTQYKIKVVPNTSSLESAGTQIAETNGSVHMGATGTFPSGVNIDCQINGTDLENSSSGDGNKVIKVFVLDANNSLWSV